MTEVTTTATATALQEGNQSVTTAAAPAPGVTAQQEPASGQPTGTAPEGQTSTQETGTENQEPSVLGAPDQYEFAPPPEGVVYDAAVLGSFSEVAKGLGLSQHAVQKIIDAVAPVMASQQVAASANLAEQWKQAVHNDPEIGGEKYQDSMIAAKKAYNLLPDSSKVFLDQSGLGNNPEIIRAFKSLGERISEDKIVMGQAPVNEKKSASKVMYPDLP